MHNNLIKELKNEFGLVTLEGKGKVSTEVQSIHWQELQLHHSLADGVASLRILEDP